MTDALDRLCGTGQTTCAAIDRLAFFAHGMTATNWAFMREMERHSISRALFQHHIDNLRNDIACPLHDHCIADANVVILLTDTFTLEAYALDVIFIVQRCIGDNHATNSNRLKACNRRQRARTSNLNVNAAQNRGCLLCRELVCDSPARATRAETKPCLQIQPVHFVDNAVDIVIELGTLKPNRPIMRNKLICAL